MSRWLLAVVLLSLPALAGCAQDKPEAATGPTTPDLDDVDVETTETLGGVRGVVVDAAIRPIGGAMVTITGGANTTTDEGGVFTFDRLEPGSYFFGVSAAGFLPQQSSADVVAGEISDVKVQLEADVSPQPYHTTLQFRGFIEAYLGFGQFVGETVAPGTLPCQCSWTVIPDVDVQTFVLDATGSVMVPDPVTHQSVYWEFVGDYLEENQQIKSGYAEFPFTVRHERGDYNNETASWLARVTGGVWPSGTMNYDLYVTMFYREAAPEGWSFLTTA